jgi:hypothetical protein
MKLNQIKTEEELSKEFQVRYLELMKRYGKETTFDRDQANSLHEELKELESQHLNHFERINNIKKIRDLNGRINKLAEERNKLLPEVKDETAN